MKYLSAFTGGSRQMDHNYHRGPFGEIRVAGRRSEFFANMVMMRWIYWP